MGGRWAGSGGWAALFLACSASLFAGYVAIGFTNVTGKMGPADVYVLFLDRNGVAQCVDTRTGEGHTPYLPDGHQDCVALSGVLTDGVLTMSFSRLLTPEVCWWPCLTWRLGSCLSWCGAGCLEDWMGHLQGFG